MPNLLKECGVDMWLVICREYNKDPVFKTLTPSLVKTYDDHRMAMGFSLIGLRVPGITIDNPGCCKKTFENYFECFEDGIRQLTNIL